MKQRVRRWKGRNSGVGGKGALDPAALTVMHDKVNKKGHAWGRCEPAGTLLW